MKLKDASWKKSYDQPSQHIKKQRHHFADKGPSSQGYGFSIVKYGCESWTIKKAEHRRIDAFELWCWRKPLDCKEIKPVLNIHWKDWCWSWKCNTLATWWEELTHLKRPQWWKRLKAGGQGDDRGWDGWMVCLTQRTWVWVNSRCQWWTGKPGVLQSTGSQRVGDVWASELYWNQS